MIDDDHDWIVNYREKKVRLEREEKEARLKSVESTRVEISEKASYIGIDCEMVRVYRHKSSIIPSSFIHTSPCQFLLL